MIRHKAFDASLRLEELEAAFSELDGAHRALTGIGNQAGKTIGSYDSERVGNRRIVLKPGNPVATQPGTVIATGVVYIAGCLETVTAYRPA